ncbi:IMP 5'-nucleotidase [Polyrhizophydium stewartii]|uniref:IMP-specific 5'-nucleotidase 1 n=1 Tax=Polyrhizophydium stewartii TaxID=2732419 RepID=A0ABR4N349_9FUNG
MSSLYSINYHLRAHKRDTFIEFIKSLLLTPFVLNTRPGADDDFADPAASADSLMDADAPAAGAVSPSVARYLEVLGCIEDLIQDHILHSDNGSRATSYSVLMEARPDSGVPELSRLSSLVPSIGRFFTSLPLRTAFLEQNAARSIAGRRSVPPSFNDIRHILNFAQIRAIAPTLKLITFDGDMTLYADGADFARDSQLVQLLLSLLRARIHVAIVTAAGYGSDPTRYEGRLSGLLEGFRVSDLDNDSLSQFYVLGGNYLFRYDPRTHHLVYIPEETYQTESVRRWSTATSRIKKILDVAESHLTKRAREMHLTHRITILRKDRAVGVYCKPGEKLTREQLDELALSTQQRIHHMQHLQLHENLQRSGLLPTEVASGASTPILGKRLSVTAVTGAAAAPVELPIPFCAFNGGSDVWVDIGNKLIGVGMLQEMLGCAGRETLHVGDQFLSTGNDIATRRACCTTWITSPEETAQVLTQLTDLLRKRPAVDGPDRRPLGAGK